MAIASMYPRDISSDVDGVKNTFSSWDSCMSKAYCKWPVIAAIIVGCLIVLSIIFCISRCLCCGLDCCCACCSCFNACCPGGRRSRSRHQPLDESPPFRPEPYKGYQAQPPPSYGPPPPQFATFDVSRSGAKESTPLSADALPAMPSWGNAATRKIETEEQQAAHEDDVELGHLDLAAVQRQPLVNNGDRTPEGYHEIYTDPSPRRTPTSPRQYAAELPGGDLGNYTRPSDYHSQTYSPPPAGSRLYSPRQPQSLYDYNQPQQPPSLSHQTYPPTAQQRPPQTFPNYGGERSYAPYSPSGSTRVEPTVYGAQETQSNYNHHRGPLQGHALSPPPAGQNDGFRPPSLLQPGRKPVQGTWRDV